MQKPKLLKVFLLIFLLSSFSKGSFSQCTRTFQFSLGGNGKDVAYDVVDAANGQFYLVGTTSSYGGGGTDVLVVKMDTGGSILWSKVYGGIGNEFIRKARLAVDGGLVMTGQTTAYSNGDILCMRTDLNGNLIWSKKFGINSFAGDIGLDIIQMNNGGFAVSGVLNAGGLVADAIVLKLDNNGNILWGKRFDTFQGEDGVGVIEKGENLLVSGDIDNGYSTKQYDAFVIKLSSSNGAYVSGLKIHPQSLGLFNPYIFANGSGFYLAGHNINLSSYSQMRPVVISLDQNFNITHSYLLANQKYTSNFYTGFIPTETGFITCSSPASDTVSYVSSIANNGSVLFSKKIAFSNGVLLNRITKVGETIAAVGSKSKNGNEDFFVCSFKETENSNVCNVDTAKLDVLNPNFSVSSLNVSSIDQAFFNTNFILPNIIVSQKSDTVCFGACSQVLPISLQDFNGSVINKKVALNFKLTKGSHAANILIERSFDAKTFNTIGSVETRSSEEESILKYFDSNAFDKNFKVFYRLKIYEASGAFFYSKVLQFKLDEINHSLQVFLYPNPARSSAKLFIEATESQLLNINVLDATGKKIISQRAQISKGINSLDIERVQTLAAGFYYVTFNLKGTWHTVKLLKQ